MISLLKVGITEEDTLRGFGWELVLSNSKNMNKADTIKNTRGKAKEGLIWRKNGMWDLIM